MSKRSYSKFTEEQDDWLITNSRSYVDWIGITRDFNKKFGYSLNTQKVRMHCKVLAKYGADILTEYPKSAKYIGKRKMSKYGRWMECIEYIDSSNLSVRFDDGVIVSNKQSSLWNTGVIMHPDDSYESQRLGERVFSEKYGMYMTLVEYRTCTDATVEFDDGVRKDTSYYVFREGRVDHPDGKKLLRVGEKNKAKCGLEMTIIDYQDYYHVRVCFEDGYETTVSYQDFKLGDVRHPKYRPRYEDIAGKTYHSYIGLDYTVISTHNDSVKFQFEDGYKGSTGRKYIGDYKNVKHPVVRLNKRVPFVYKGYLAQYFYHQEGIGAYFVCKCPKCGLDELLLLKEMKDGHICKGEY